MTTGVPTSRKPQQRTRGKPTSVDAHVGRRIQLRRRLVGISQAELGEVIGLTYQQIQKYEKGVNRIGAGRLHQLGQALEVPVSYFFEGLDGEATATTPETGEDKLLSRSNIDLLRAYDRISDPDMRHIVRQLIQRLAGDDLAEEASAA